MKTEIRLRFQPGTCCYTGFVKMGNVDAPGSAVVKVTSIKVGKIHTFTNIVNEKAISKRSLKINSSALLRSARKTLTLEAQSILTLRSKLNGHFIKCLTCIHHSPGRVVITGIGKSAIIANKIVSTFNSTGTPAIFMHAADAIHGDLGTITKDDIVMCISNSGESPEIKVLIPLIKSNGNVVIALAGNPNSFLARNADFFLDASVAKEACPNNLAPTSSTAAQMALGDALAVCLLEMHGFTSGDFAKFHPGGSIGKKLYLTVHQLSSQHAKPFVYVDDTVSKVILEITSKRLGATAVLNRAKHLTGIITDGDLRRMMKRNKDFNTLFAKNIMSRNPKTIQQDALAVNALEIMRKNKITQLIVLNRRRYEGIVHVHDLLKEGLV